LDVQLCRHGPATVFVEFLNNRLCHYGVFGWISCDNQNITNFKEKLLKKLPKFFNYQKSQKNREILPKVIKITKSGHTAISFPEYACSRVRLWHDWERDWSHCYLLRRRLGSNSGRFGKCGSVYNPYILPRTQASLCKKIVMRIWRVYMKY
jgi:hypothetical protein